MGWVSAFARVRAAERILGMALRGGCCNATWHLEREPSRGEKASLNLP